MSADAPVFSGSVLPGSVPAGTIGELAPHAPPALAGTGQPAVAPPTPAVADIRVGVPVRLSARVIRVTAGNGGLMTGPGTNSYLLRAGRQDEGDWALIDPGPLDGAHVDALTAAAPGPVRWIFVTHTHHDHSPATLPLRARYPAARVLGRLPAHPQSQDASFRPDQLLRGGERIVLDASAGGTRPAGAPPAPSPDASTLRVIHTPGHASNHLCYLLEEEAMLFTGDHLMQASTVVIRPPDGDMAAYIASLQALLGLEDAQMRWLAPGHGTLMAQPRRAVEAVIAHRLRREARVVEALRRHGPAPAAALLAPVYDDIDPRLHGAALHSLTAHLFKLRDAGLACQDDQGGWVACRPGAPR